LTLTELFESHSRQSTNYATVLFIFEVYGHYTSLDLLVGTALEDHLCWESGAETGITWKGQACEALKNRAFAAGLVANDNQLPVSST